MKIDASLATFGGLIVAAWAQFAARARAPGDSVLGGLAVAAGLFVYGISRTASGGALVWRGPLAVGAAAEGAPGAERLSRGRISARLLVTSGVLGGITFLTSGANLFTPLNTTTWLLSIVTALAAGWLVRAQTVMLLRSPERRRAHLSQLREVRLRPTREHVAVLGVLLLGAFMLFYRLPDVPPEMTSDHAEKLLDVQDVLDGQHRIFFPRNTGREAFQFYLIALMTPLTGLSFLTMKLGTALLAWLSIPFTMLFARVLFGMQVALIAGAFMATSRWLLHVGRMGLRFPFPPVFAAAIFYFLMKALQHRRRNDFLLAGLVLGLSQHTYTPLRVAPVGVALCLGIALAVDIWRREPAARVRRLMTGSLLLFYVALLVFMPAARYAIDHPGAFFLRGLSRIGGGAGGPSAPATSALPVLLDNVKNALLMFNWRGDVAWVNNISNEPMLDPISGALFVLGVAYALYRLVRFRELPFLYVLVILFVGLAPSILSIAFPAENPGGPRSGMAIPEVMMLVALPACLLARRLMAWIDGAAGRIAASVFLGALLLGAWRLNYEAYFQVYPGQYNGAAQHTSDVARAANGFIALGGRAEDVHVVLWPHWFDLRLLAVQMNRPRLLPGINSVDEARGHDGLPRPRLYVVHPEDRNALDRLTSWYPAAIRQTHTLPELDGRPYFVTVLVPANARVSA